MNSIVTYFSELFEAIGAGGFVVIGIFVFIGVVAQFALYAKCNLPGIACIVPVWNVIVFLKIMGRPWHHMFYLLIPIYNIYFIVKLYIELANCFGRTKTIDYVLIIVLNGLYVFNLGLSYEAEYKGPVYQPVDRSHGKEPQLATS